MFVQLMYCVRNAASWFWVAAGVGKWPFVSLFGVNFVTLLPIELCP